MICLSSAAVVRLARAKAEMDAADPACDKVALSALRAGKTTAIRRAHEARLEFDAAAKAVADEAIAEGHHTRQGD